MKRFLIFLLATPLLLAMEPFSRDDRQQVRKQVARYILSKQNNSIPLDAVVATSPTLQRLNAQGVIKDFATNSAILEDSETHARYRVNLGTKKIEEIKLTKN